MESKLSRREFLKAAALIGMSQLGLPGLVNHTHLNQQESPEVKLPNILIITFDALSAYHLGLYGYTRQTSPNITRLAERATVFNMHYSAGNFTSPGTASLLTGAYPWSHRAFHLHGTVADNYIQKNIFHLFSEKKYYKIAYSHNLLVMSLFEQFREDIELFKKTRELCLADDEFADLLHPNDYNVAFWSEWLSLRGEEPAPSSLFLSLAHRLLRSYHKRELTKKYGDLFPRGIPNLHNLLFILEQAIDWLISEVKSFPQPFLGYFHFNPPHEPYTTRRDFINIFADGWNPKPKPNHFFSEGHPQEFLDKNRREYDEYIAYADAEFGRLYDFLLQSDLLENTYLVLTSDHGELFERGIRGHVTPVLYQPLIRVPLLIVKPGQQTRVDVRTSTSSVDLLPTLLYATGQPIPDWCEGDILPTFVDIEKPQDRMVYAMESKGNPKHSALTKATFSLIHNRYKLIRYLGQPRPEKEYELYDIETDPEELEDQSLRLKDIASDLQAMLAEKIQQVNQPYSK